MSEKKTGAALFTPGKEIYAWTAFDYHPHSRGPVWIALFCIVFFGGALWAVLQDNTDWGMALTFLFAAAIYFWVHRKGEDTHQVRIFENGLLVDRKYYDWKKFSGYWFAYDPSVSVIHFQIDDEKRDRKVSLQMGTETPESLRLALESSSLSELEDKKEGLFDLWIRALKL